MSFLTPLNNTTQSMYPILFIFMCDVQHPGERDRTINLNEFIEYYNNISCSVDNDEYFELMIRNAWNLDNKPQQQKGWRGEF